MEVHALIDGWLDNSRCQPVHTYYPRIGVKIQTEQESCPRTISPSPFDVIDLKELYDSFDDSNSTCGWRHHSLLFESMCRCSFCVVILLCCGYIGSTTPALWLCSPRKSYVPHTKRAVFQPRLASRCQVAPIRGPTLEGDSGLVSLEAGGRWRRLTGYTRIVLSRFVSLSRHLTRISLSE